MRTDIRQVKWEIKQAGGIEKMAECECPMKYGYDGIEEYCNDSVENAYKCIDCWKEALKIDIENPKVKADMDLINFRPEITD